MKPIIKWAGGKTQLLSELKLHLPKERYGHYFEPFLGGGAFLFDLLPAHAVVNDSNTQLINVYLSVKNHPHELVDKIKFFDAGHENASDQTEYYKTVRSEYNMLIDKMTTEQAARFIYLNKHCFNGLYRVNSKGEFNVPFNKRKVGKSCNPSDIFDMSNYLQIVEFRSTNFYEGLEGVQPYDFVYLDPPYLPVSSTSFTKYSAEDFIEQQHRQIATIMRKFQQQHIYCMCSNSLVNSTYSLFTGLNIYEASVSRMINSNSENRTGFSEAIITNY